MTSLSTNLDSTYADDPNDPSVKIHQQDHDTLAVAVNALTAAPVLMVLVHNGSAYPARPPGAAAGAARYVGPTQPTTWLAGDEWVNNA